MGSARAIIATAILLAAPVEAVAGPEPSQAELRAAKALDDVRGDPLALNEFLKRMPKGGELHLHLHSAVFAETLI
jgi:adenosine deaminase